MGDTRTRILMVPPNMWQRERSTYVPGTGPDPRRLENSLSKHGVDVELIDPNTFPLNPLDGRGIFFRSFDPWRALTILIRHRKIDGVVVVFEGGALPLVALRRLFAFKPRILIWDIGLTEGWPRRERIQDFLIPRLDGIMVLSQTQKPYIAKRWAPKCPIDVVGYSIDTEFFRPMDTEPGDYFFSVGNDYGRDYGTLLQAVEGVEGRCVIRTNTDLRDSATRLPQVTVLRQRISDLELRDLYSQARFVVIPLIQTLNASGVTSVLEASAMGKALIVSDNKAIEEYIIPGETCLQVPTGDATKLREAIARLNAEPETCARLGRNGRAFVERKWSSESFAARFAETLRARLGA